LNNDTSFYKHTCGGVEFDWYGAEGDPPTMLFYQDAIPGEVVQAMIRISLHRSPIFLYTLMIQFNGTSAIKIPAILDTGSPITIFNNAAAKLADIHATEPPN
jgi:hypothetical protein